MLGAPGASIEGRDSAEEEGWSDSITYESGDKSGPVDCTTGVGEGDDETSRSSKGALLSAVCSKVAASGGEVDVIELGGGVFTESSGVRRRVVLGNISMSGVVPATTGSGEVPGLMAV